MEKCNEISRATKSVTKSATKSAEYLLQFL